MTSFFKLITRFLELEIHACKDLIVSFEKQKFFNYIPWARPSLRVWWPENCVNNWFSFSLCLILLNKVQLYTNCFLIGFFPVNWSNFDLKLFIYFHLSFTLNTKANLLFLLYISPIHGIQEEACGKPFFISVTLYLFHLTLFILTITGSFGIEILLV